MPRLEFTPLLEAVAAIVELFGVGVVVIGFGVAFVRYVSELRARASETYRTLRHDLGRSILLGLELLVAADIIRTVAVPLTLEGVAALAGIVLIRTFLSFALEVELTGTLPWRRDRSSNA